MRRPARWTEPMDASMTDADVKWLRSRQPFASMDESAFPRGAPIEGIIRGDTRLHRCEPGEVIVREGDYGNSAFLVLSGETSVLVDSLDPKLLGRPPVEKKSWIDALGEYLGQSYLGRSKLVEARRPDQVTTDLPANDEHDNQNNPASIRQVDDRPAVFLQDFGGVLKGSNTITIGPGELFGEVAAMYRSPRTATVIAKTETTLLEIRWQGLRILRRDPCFADTLDKHYRENWLTVHLRELPLLRHLPEAGLERVAKATQMRSYGRMEWNADYKKSRTLPVEQQIASEPLVASEGAMPTDLIIVRSGFARLSQAYGASERTTAYLGKGHLFGLEEVATNSARTDNSAPRTLKHSLRAVGFLDTLQIPVEVFATEILPFVRRSELPEQVAALLQNQDADRSGKEDRRKSNRDKAVAKSDWNDLPTSGGQRFQPTGLLEFVVQNRLNNGQQAMVIDLHRCTRCDDCVRACAATHDGNPRFTRQGISHERLQFTQACMQCDDPVCMIGCPTGAITRNDETGVVGIHESICVGCGVCASSCPYENINMVQVQDHAGRPYTDIATQKPIQKATKCDMCQDSPSGPACAAACPHDALVRIDLTQSKPLRDWLDQRGAT
ncbi:cyclic nucleotide-binding domain-containing protein [Rubripirellula obstinata]|uniref:cyclic nucleotide-binding domain-containing protein n=1 Tax=Rubripirellula obstinata TaxID=406547 RepID=UPI001EE3C286|nr:cyclic nucleotide-binding domain-containing protein [Rubripirellula obstinata]